MAGPTDVLTEDVKELREANRGLADEIKRVFDRLSGEMRDSNQRLADAMRESNQRLADAINRLGGDFGNFRVEVAKELGAINANLETFKGNVAKDLGGINTNLETFKGNVAKDLGGINTNLETFKGNVAKDLGGSIRTSRPLGTHGNFLSVAKWAVATSVPVLLGLVVWSYSAYARAVHIEDSIVALRDHAKEQDERIAKLIDLHREPAQPNNPQPPKPPGRRPGAPSTAGKTTDPSKPKAEENPQ